MPRTRNWRTLALVFACAFPFLGFWSTGLTDLDEGFYGSVVANMLRSGDWVTPHYNGAPWFEKPILTYWLAAPSVALFGDDFGPRLPSVVCTLLTAFVLYRFLARHVGNDKARVVAAAYCGSLLVVGVGRMLMTDAPFVLALTVAMTTFYDSITSDSKHRHWTAVALGFAVLAKGPVAIVLFALVAAFAFWRLKDSRENFRSYWLTGFALFAAVVAAWYVPCYLKNGDLFVQKFLIEQNFGRFGGGDKAHGVPWWSHPVYFPGEVLIALVPWVFWVRPSKWVKKSEDGLINFLWIWGLVVLAFFTVSQTKLPHYVLPAMAPFTAIVVLAVMDRGTTDFWLKSAAAWCACAGTLATIVFQLDYQSRFKEIHSIAKRLRSEEGRVVQFKTSRIKDSGSPTALNETTYPSFFFYLGREGVLTDQVKEASDFDGTVWIVTRKDRMDPDTVYEFVLSGFGPKQADIGVPLKSFEVWRLDPLLPGDVAPALK